jgi:hypothetical protein
MVGQQHSALCCSGPHWEGNGAVNRCPWVRNKRLNCRTRRLCLSNAAHARLRTCAGHIMDTTYGTKHESTEA